MDWLTFITKIIESISWPLSLVIGVLLIRKPLLRAIPYLRKLKYSDVEMEFGQEIANLKSDIIEATTATKQIYIAPARLPDRIIQLANVSPEAALEESWKEVVSVIELLVQRNIDKIKDSDRKSLITLVDRLSNSNVIAERFAKVIRSQYAMTERLGWQSDEANKKQVMQLIHLNIELADIMRGVYLSRDVAKKITS